MREESALGVAGVVLNMHAGSRGPHPPVLSTDVTMLADYGWGFRYWSRVLVFPWGDLQPDRPTVLNKDTFYTSRVAYTLFPLAEGDTPAKRLDALDRIDRRLRRPLRVDHLGAGPW